MNYKKPFILAAITVILLVFVVICQTSYLNSTINENLVLRKVNNRLFQIQIMRVILEQGQPVNPLPAPESTYEPEKPRSI